MYIKKHVNFEIKQMKFQIKSFRKIFLVPLFVIYFIIPILLIATFKKYNDIEYVEEYFRLFTQYLIPVFSTWWISFAFMDIIETSGNEIHFLYMKSKDNLVLSWMLLYLLFVGIGYLVASIWIPNILLEYIRISISCCFYVSLGYFCMFAFNSITMTILVNIVYWILSVVTGQIPLDVVNCFDGSIMSIDLLCSKYIFILFNAIIIYIIAYVINAKYERYH